MSEQEDDKLSAEKNIDVLDQAAAVTDFLTGAAVAEQRALAAPESHPLFDGTHCVEEECGAEIPEARLALRKVRCIECQERLEKQRSGRAPRWS